MKLSILHKGLIIVSIPLLFEIFFVVVLMGLLEDATRHIRKQIRSQDKIVCVETMLKELADSTTTAIIYNVTRNKEILDRNEQSRRRLLVAAEKLNRLTRGDSQEQEACSRMRASSALWLRHQEDVINSPPRDRLSSFLNVQSGGQTEQLLIMRSEGSAKRIIDREKNLQTVEPGLRRQAIFKIHLFLLFGLVVNITITAFLAVYMARYLSARLDNVIANTFKLGARLPLNPPLRGEDEMAELDEALHASATELLEFEAFKEQLIGVVSHELRTPLTSISGTLTLLEAGAMGSFPDHAVTEVGRAQESLKKLIDLVNNMLLLERLEAGSQIVKQEELSLARLLETILGDREVAIEAKNLSINATISDISLVGDPDLLPLALGALLSASIARAPEESTIDLAVAETVENVEVRMSDRGRALRADESSLFFSRFHNHPDASEVLSHSLIKAIVNAHGGSVAAQSDGGITTLVARLPYRRVATDA
ncbi:MAG: HAMP domain-containing histidine kinase [Cyanobacteria bacterium HKST-UBA02]|nr:HAMP domain-containing histidine kinase [Cyanobacteria bacterium HKST-UBA02]